MQEELETEQPEMAEAVETEVTEAAEPPQDNEVDLDAELEASIDRWQESLDEEGDEREQSILDEEPVKAEAKLDVNDGDRPAEPKAETPTQDEPSEGIRSLREANKEKAKQIKELEARLAQLEEASKPKPEPPDEVSRIEQEYTTEQMLEFLARYETGEAEGDESRLRELRSVAIQALERKDSGEIYDVMRRAQANKFGSLSRDVEDAATQALTRAVAYERMNAGKKQAQVQWQESRNASLAALNEIEGLIGEDGKLNDESEIGKAYLDAGQELAEVIPTLAQIPNAPEIVLQYTQLLQAKQQNEALAQENAELRKRLGRAERPIPAGEAPVSKSNRAKSAEDELAAAFASAGLTGA